MSVKARIIVASVCAIVAVACVIAYAANVRGQASGERDRALERYGGETATVLVASRAISAGEVFSERNVEELEWLVDLLPEGALADSDEVIGKTAACAIAQNTPLAAVHVESAADPLSVPAGMVALSVPCSNDSAVGGELPAGSVVNVYAVGEGSAKPVAQGIQVLKTNVTSGLGSLSWAVLAVEPDQVEALVAVSATQKLYLTLPSDEGVRDEDASQQASEAERAVAQGLTEAYGTPDDAVATAQGQGAGEARQAGGDSGAASATEDADGAAGVTSEPVQAADAVEAADAADAAQATGAVEVVADEDQPNSAEGA